MKVEKESRCESSDFERVFGKLVFNAELLLDGAELLSAQELEKLAGVLRVSAAALGFRPELDDEEQRANIKVLLARAGANEPVSRDIVVRFEGDAAECAL